MLTTVNWKPICRLKDTDPVTFRFATYSHYFDLSLLKLKYSSKTNISWHFIIFCQYITNFVLESLQKAHRCSYLYTNYVSYMHLKIYFFEFIKSNVPGFSPNFCFCKPVLKIAFNHNTTVKRIGLNITKK